MRLGKRFSAGQGHAAAGTCIKKIIFFNSRHHIINRLFFTIYDNCLCRTLICKKKGIFDKAMVDIHLAVFALGDGSAYRPVSAVGALIKPDTFIAVISDFGLKGLRFRVGAPFAAKGTAF